jgi:hypothetical protein
VQQQQQAPVYDMTPSLQLSQQGTPQLHSAPVYQHQHQQQQQQRPVYEMTPTPEPAQRGTTPQLQHAGLGGGGGGGGGGEGDGGGGGEGGGGGGGGGGGRVYSGGSSSSSEEEDNSFVEFEALSPKQKDLGRAVQVTLSNPS